ncbi:hypothetical protein ACSW29_06210 [Rhodococcus sp. GB-02]
MSDAQDFRANAFIHTVLRPQLDILRDEHSEDDILLAYSLDAVQRVVARQSDGEPPEDVDPGNAVELLLLLNELELFNFGLRVGYFSDNSEDRIEAFRREVKNYVSSLDSYWDGHSDQFDETLKIVNKDYTWDVVDELQVNGYDLFIDRYSRNRNLNSIEVKETLEVLIFSTNEEWSEKIETVRKLAGALVEDSTLRLSDSEVDELSWALSGADLLLDGEQEYGFVSQFPNLVEKIILNEQGYAFGRRVELVAARQRIFDSTSRLGVDEVVAALRTLQTNAGEEVHKFSPQVPSLKQSLQRAIDANPRRELDE